MEDFSPVPSEYYATVCHLVAGLARAADIGTIEQYLGLMTEDAVFEFCSIPHLGVEAKTFRGRDEVRQGALARRAAGMSGPGTHTVHLVSTTNAWTLDESTVRGLTFFSYYADADKVPVLRTMGHYDDTFRRVDGVWLLAHRIISRI